MKINQKIVEGQRQDATVVAYQKGEKKSRSSNGNGLATVVRFFLLACNVIFLVG